MFSQKDFFPHETAKVAVCYNSITKYGLAQDSQNFRYLSGNDVEQNCNYLRPSYMFWTFINHKPSPAEANRLLQTQLLIFIIVTKLLFLMCYQKLLSNELILYLTTSLFFIYLMNKLAVFKVDLELRLV